MLEKYYYLSRKDTEKYCWFINCLRSSYSVVRDSSFLDNPLYIFAICTDDTTIFLIYINAISIFSNSEQCGIKKFIKTYFEIKNRIEQDE